MPKQSKAPPSQALLNVRAALATNLRAFLVIKHPGEAETTAAEIIASKTGIGKNTILRALGRGDQDKVTDMRLDTLVRLASHFDATVTDLLRDHTARKPIKRKGKAEVVRAEASQRGSLQRRAG